MVDQQVIPEVDTYTEELEAARPRTVHRMCELCVPEPHPGDQAVCGHVIQGRPARRGDLPCLKCAQVWRSHVLGHFAGRA